MATSTATTERSVEHPAHHEERGNAAPRERAYALVETEKRRVGGELTSLAKALEGAAASLRQEHGDAAWLAGQAASRLGELAETIGESDVGVLGGRLRDLARRRPAVLFAGGVMAGLLLTRALGRAEGSPSSTHRPDTGGDGETRPLGVPITDAPLTAGYGGMRLEEST